MQIAAALESGIEHPIANAFKGVASVELATDVEYRVGFGVSGTVDGRRYFLGSAKFVDVERSDESCVWLADKQGVLARIVLADRVRRHASDAVSMLAKHGRIALLSGDTEAAVSTIARELGVSSWQAEQTPDGKLDYLSSLQSEGAVVAAVGDGINDAPLLGRADVSVAMLEGSRLAQASADVVFTGRDLRTLGCLPALAKTTRRIVLQNLIWAAVYNLLAVPLAALGLLAPWMAAIGMSISSLVVVGNALRLNRLLVPQIEAEASTAVNIGSIEEFAP